MRASNKCDLVRLLVLHVWARERCKTLHPLPSRGRRDWNSMCLPCCEVSPGDFAFIWSALPLPLFSISALLWSVCSPAHTYANTCSLFTSWKSHLGAKRGAPGSSRGTVHGISSCPFGGRREGNLRDKHKNRKVMCEWKKRINGGWFVNSSDLWLDFERKFWRMASIYFAHTTFCCSIRGICLTLCKIVVSLKSVGMTEEVKHEPPEGNSSDLP